MGNLQTKWAGTETQPSQSNSPPPSSLPNTRLAPLSSPPSHHHQTSSSSSLANGSGQQHPQPPLTPLSSHLSDRNQTPQEGALCGDLQGKLELKDEGGVGVESLDKVSIFGEKGANGEGVEVDDHRDIEGWESNSWEDDCVRARVRVSVNDGDGDGDGVGAEKRKKRSQYPKKPEAPDCVFYMKGTCKFGSNCKFNHSSDMKAKVAKQQSREREEPAERSGQTECKYYSTLPAAELNFLDLPIRPGEKDCPYYMQHGSCKFGGDCMYNHPDPTVEGFDPPSPARVNDTSSFVPMMLSPAQVSSQGSYWNAYQEPIYPSVVSMHPPTHIMNNPAINTNTSPHQQRMQVGVDEFAEIPEDSKSKSKRKKNKLASLPPSNLNDKSLPLGPAVGSSSALSSSLPLTHEAATLLPNQTKGSRSMRCEVCKINCNSKDVYEKHISGKKHLKNMEINANTMLANGGNNVGNIVRNSQDVYNKHIAGKKHVAQVALMSNNGIGPWNKAPKKIKVMQPVWCDTCKITCNNRDMYASHLVGKKHLNNLEKQSKPEANANAGKLLIGPQEKPNADKPKSNKAKDLDIEAKKLKVVEGGTAADSVRMCTLCNVVCNSETVFNAHLAGHKHASMVKEQTLESSGTTAS
ncbi:hypothetical protein PIB30_003936 [Stylosanthes scabra]|uniref:C3H1-type domain-containing protein n=1 Tax=Stylosanthes scabra TaxID=79078 RepID=A0ABU6V5N1_9FABA|nr:hypothetical protein [Stylosanthes scabra]